MRNEFLYIYLLLSVAECAKVLYHELFQRMGSRSGGIKSIFFEMII